MPKIDTHAPGTFCWSELLTSDMAHAKRFYTRLFEWQVREDKLPGGGAYDMFCHRGKNACAGYTATPEALGARAGAYWKPYLAVADVDAMVAKAEAKGARVVTPPTDVGDAGRTALLTDPSGADFSLWQSKRAIGAETMHEPGTLVWFELATRDLDAAEKFYTGLFGWQTSRKDFGAAGATCTMITCTLDGKPIAGLLRMTDPWGLHAIWREQPPHWYCYFGVTDCKGSAAHVQGYGGRVLVEPQPIPGIGSFAMIQDPAGAVLGLMSFGR